MWPVYEPHHVYEYTNYGLKSVTHFNYKINYTAAWFQKKQIFSEHSTSTSDSNIADTRTYFKSDLSY